MNRETVAAYCRIAAETLPLADDICDGADAEHRKHRSAETQDNATLAHDLDTTALGNRDLAIAPYIVEAFAME